LQAKGSMLDRTLTTPLTNWYPTPDPQLPSEMNSVNRESATC